jgi:glycosyltransferase involved in cell wall biosynthesis
MKLLIYIPAYNEEENILGTINNLPRQVPGINLVECLVIDDGSTDQTAVIAHSAGVAVQSLPNNKGVGAAFHAAVDYALENGADILVGIDADGQFDPAEIPAMIQPILENRADAVVGSRFQTGKPENMPRLKYWGNQIVAGLISSLGGQKFDDVSCGFRAYNREALLHLNLFAQFTYTHETILSLVYQGLRVIELPVSIRYFPERKSRVASSILHYALQTSKIILRVMLDYQPMRIFGTVGFVLLFIGIAFEIFLLGHYFFIGGFSPYKSVGFIGLGFFIFGMFVLIIALVADMLNRLRINQDKLLYEYKKTRYSK